MANKKTINLYDGNVEITFYPDSHRYLKDGKPLISVTAATGIIDKSRVLIWWATNLMKDYLFEFVNNNEDFSLEDLYNAIEEAAKQHQVKKEEAADIGSQVHEWCEMYIKAKINGDPEPEMPNDDKVLNGITAFLEWLSEHKVKFHCSERLVYSKKHNYVGTLDAIATVNGKKYLIDFKTSKGVYNEFFYQVAAYRAAYEEETGEKLDGSIIIHFDKDTGEFEVIDIDNHKKDYKVFLACLTIKKREKELSKKI